MAATEDEQVGIPPLLRAARGSYGNAIRSELAAAGFDDLPRSSAYVLGGMVNHGGSAGQLVRQLGVSKQAASQLIDTLVIRGYLQRSVDPEDRRRIAIEVTERGRAAALAISKGIQKVDAELAGLISAEQMEGLRSGLIALCSIRERMEGERRGEAPPTP